MSDGITFNIDQALDKLGQLVEKHGPQAVDIAAHVVQINAINSLMGSVGFGIVTAILFVLVRVCIKGQKDIDWIDNPLPFAGMWLFSISGLALFIFAVLPPLFTAWTWVALFNPKLALAHDIYQRIAGQ